MGPEVWGKVVSVGCGEFEALLKQPRRKSDFSVGLSSGE
jgi:hypothetical protein